MGNPKLLAALHEYLYLKELYSPPLTLRLYIFLALVANQIFLFQFPQASRRKAQDICFW